ncbi:MAG: hypothetical protein AAF401_05430 [Pseudomonadota bacterium]
MKDGAEIHAKPVKRRRVLYAHGFDPATSERYRRLMARAGAERDGPPPAISQVAPMSDVSEGWRVNAVVDGQSVETIFEVLRYEDIVRQWRGRALPIRLATGLSSWFRFILNGGLRRVFAVAKGPGGLFFYPVFMLLAFIGIGVFTGRMAGEGAELLGAPDWASQVGRAIGALAGLWLSVRAERAFFAHLMLGLFDFMFHVAREKPPAGRLEMRVELFAHRIADAVRTAQDKKVDEVLVVGHSLGALVAARALARAMEQDIDLTGGNAKVSLLTLGSVAGYVSCHGGVGADRYAFDLGRVASDEDLSWVDVSAPRDWFSFGLVDPLLLIDDAPLTARSPRVISAKFGRFRPDPEDKRTRFRAMGLHMKYLAAPDRDGGFDFFAVTSGPLTLKERFAERRNSPKAKMLTA